MEFAATAAPEGADQLPSRPLYHHLALTVYWLSNSLLWGALLHQALQSRMRDWFTESQAGYYFAILGIAGGIVGTGAQIIVGALSDRSLSRHGRRRPFFVPAVLLSLLPLLWLGSSKSFWPFAAALVVLQLFSNSALGPFSSLLPDTVNPKEHGKASGFMGVARLLGDTGGLVLTGILLSTNALHVQHGVKEDGLLPPGVLSAFHDHQMFLLCAMMAGFMLVTMIFAAFAIKEKPLKERPDLTTWQAVKGSFKVDVRGNQDFFWLSLSRGVTNIGFYMFLEVLYFFLAFSLKVPDPSKTNMFLMLPAIGCAVAVSVPAGLLSDKYGRLPLIYASQFLMAFATAIFAFAPNLTWAYVATIPAGLAYGVLTAVEWALACNLLPKGETARYLGVWNASAVVPQIFAFLIAGVVGSRISAIVPGLGWRVDFGITVVACLVGAYFLRHVHERQDDKPQPACRGGEQGQA
ncbi:MAG: MFS transporter [Armatimonadota bacterium]